MNSSTLLESPQDSFSEKKIFLIMHASCTTVKEHPGNYRFHGQTLALFTFGTIVPQILFRVSILNSHGLRVKS